MVEGEGEGGGGGEEDEGRRVRGRELLVQKQKTMSHNTSAITSN